MTSELKRGMRPSRVTEVDAREQGEITSEQAALFREHGLLIVRGLLSDAELHELQHETLTLVERAKREDPVDPYLEDFAYLRHALTGNRVPSRVEYVVDKTPACRALLAHPFVLRSVQKLQGCSFIPTWDSMVFKFPGEGAQIDWHRDATRDCTDERPVFNVDFYLDRSDLSNCLWGIPGSHRLSDDEAARCIDELAAHGFGTDGAVPLPMNPGDVIFHDILTLHGSPAARSELRRVIYHEFRPIETELALGPHVPDYVPLKQQVLMSALEFRQTRAYSRGERTFDYAPDARFSAAAAGAALENLRIPHARYWRANAA